MSAPTQNPSSSFVAESAPSGKDANSSYFSRPVFLMINSLERGGTERQYVELAQSLKRAGSPVNLGCIQPFGPFLEDLTVTGFSDMPAFGLGGSLYGLESVRCRWRLMRHLRKLEIAVAHSFDFYTNLTLVPAAKLARVPVLGSQRQLGDLLTKAQSRAQLEMFRWCDRVVCNSKAAADLLLRSRLAPSKVVVIGNGLPAAAFARTTAVLERQPGLVRVGMIARMNTPSKNHSVFLRAAASVTQRFSDVEFVVVGDGPLRGDFEKQAADLGIQRQVQFLGDRSDIAGILASTDVLVIPSATESLSNVMLEAMAAGVPIIATAVGGNVELGADNRAVLVPANDGNAIAAELERLLLDEKARKQFAERARAYALENFMADRIREQYCALYAEVAK